MYVIIGWFLVAAVIVLTAPFWLRYLSKLFKWQGPAMKRLIKFLRALHKPLGAAAVVLVIVHGLLALGALRLHTGTLAGLFLVITAVLGGSFYRLKKKALFSLHKRAALVFAILIIVHLLFPSAVYQLLGI